jgi:CO/xanthine dehydrogenase Mo-binding subunit
VSDPLPPSLAANPRLAGWLGFSAGGLVTVRPGKVEYGQGVWTALAQIAAEELDVRLDQVRIAPVSTGSSPDEGVTSGSRSIEDSGGALHWVCAQAHAALLAAAAARLEMHPATLSVQAGEVRTAAGGTGLSYWSVDIPGLLGAAAEPGPPAKPPALWSVAGRSVPRIDLPDKATGRPRFLHDLVLPGMLFGRVVRPPAPSPA